MNCNPIFIVLPSAANAQHQQQQQPEIVHIQDHEELIEEDDVEDIEMAISQQQIGKNDMRDMAQEAKIASQLLQQQGELKFCAALANIIRKHFNIFQYFGYVIDKGVY